MTTPEQNAQNTSWMDFRLREEAMNHLWDIINNPEGQTRVKGTLAGNLLKSKYIQDKDDLFYENILKECSEHLYYKEWSNYYSVYVAKNISPPVFALKELWANCQKKHEFNPPHTHAG